MDSIAVHCPQCGMIVGGWKIEGDRARTECARCGANITVSIENVLGERFKDPTAVVPEGLVLENQDGKWEVIYPWIGNLASVLIQALFTIVVTVLIYMLFMASRPNAFGEALIAGIWIYWGYTLVAHLVNRSCFRIEEDSLIVTHGPLPWRLGRKLPLKSIMQLYCKRQVAHSWINSKNYGEIKGVFYSYSYPGMKRQGGILFHYKVYAALKGGKRIVLAGPFSKLDQALYLEKALEQQLGLADIFVPGGV